MNEATIHTTGTRITFCHSNYNNHNISSRSHSSKNSKQENSLIIRFIITQEPKANLQTQNKSQQQNSLLFICFTAIATHKNILFF